MGTNYYVEPEPPCPHCGRGYGQIHIGKSSGGWCFALHVIPAEDAEFMDGVPDCGIISLADWQHFWEGGRIVDEYGRPYTAEEMLKVITERKWERRAPDDFDYAGNEAEPGPAGLVRHRIDGRHCVGHGAGTWDMIRGEFS